MATQGVPHTLVEKLNDTNYASWKYSMKLLLMDRELWSVVSGTLKAPEAAATATEKEKFETKKTKALSTIGLGVSTDLHHLISDCEDPKIVWDTLKAVFEPKSRVRILQLKRKLVNIRLLEGETMTNYLGRIMTVVRDLKEADDEVKDTDVAYMMMAGLPESYDGIVVQFNTVEDSKFTSIEVKKALIVEYERRVTRSEEQDGAKGAYYTRNSGGETRQSGQSLHPANANSGTGGRPTGESSRPFQSSQRKFQAWKDNT